MRCWSVSAAALRGASASMRVPRRCRGLTEGETARAVILRLWRSSASPMRRRLRAEAAEDSDVDGRDVTNL